MIEETSLPIRAMNIRKMEQSSYILNLSHKDKGVRQEMCNINKIHMYQFNV